MTVHLELGDSLVQAVDRAGPSVVRVEGARATASGFVWDAGGTVVTTERLVGACRGEVAVTLATGERRAAELVGRDRAFDVAVLRIAPEGLVPIARHDADDLAVGQPVVALGRPGNGLRASLRIVGLLARDVVVGPGKLDRYVETDRGFPPGFSGGPLIDLAGAAIGLDTPYAIRGADLTIPTAQVARLVAEITAYGAVRRGYLGVAVQRARLPQPIAAALGRATGALVLGVDDGSPAAAGGLLLGDVIVELDGASVDGPDGLRAVLAARGGAATAVRALRAGGLTELEVTVGQRGAR